MPEDRTIFLGRCPDAVQPDHIHAHYRALGKDSIASILFPRPKGVFKGFGHVTFRSAELAAQAAAMPPPVVAGRTLLVSYKAQRDAPGKRVATLLKDWQGTKLAKVAADVDADTVSGALPRLPPVDWSTKELRPFQKDFSSLLHLTADEAGSKEFRHTHGFKVSGKHPPALQLEEVEWPPPVTQNLPAAFRSPTPLQCQLWPMVLRGVDVLGTALHGQAGRLLAYLLPAVVHLKAQRRSRAGQGPVAVVVLGTRQLVEQGRELVASLQAEVRVTGVFPGLDSDANRIKQARRLRDGADLVLGTPGRLHDLLEAQTLALDRCSFLVVDGLDDMLAQGFRQHLSNLLGQCRPDRQTVVLCERRQEEAVSFAQSFLHDPAVLTVKAQRREPVDSSLHPVDAPRARVQQRVHLCSTAQEKRAKLLEIVQACRGASGSDLQAGLDYTRGLVVCRSRHTVDEVALFLRSAILNVHGCHSASDSQQQQEFVRSLEDDPHGVLVTTGTYLQSVDLPPLAWLVNFDMPKEIAEYRQRLSLADPERDGAVETLFHPVVDRPLAGPLIGVMSEAKCLPPKALFLLTDMDL
eukprot:GGOE01015447.1.p1 GENE.GGOE01015447.1~~GGOE01015447.1.p1  ORF type:complete len:587 (+),score=179.69 GGOE01015447.1:25-1761(+)